MKSKNFNGYLYCILSAIMVAIICIFVKKMSYVSNTAYFSIYQYFFSFFILFFLKMYKKKKVDVSKNISTHIFRSISSVLIFVFYYISLIYLPETISNLLLNTAPIFIFLISIFYTNILGQSKIYLAFNFLSTIVVAIGVMTILVDHGSKNSNHIGYILAIISGFFYALSTIFVKLTTKHEDLFSCIYKFYLITFIFSLIFISSLILRNDFEIKSFLYSIPISLLSLLQIFFITKGIKLSSPIVASILSMFSIVFLFFYNTIFLKTNFHLIEYIGIMTIMFGIIVTCLSQKFKKETKNACNYSN